MPTRPDSADQRYIVTGHYRRGTSYAALRPQGCHDHLLIYTVAGAGRFTHAGGEFVAAPHEVVLIEPFVPHGYATDARAGRWELLWAHFVPPPSWRPWLQWPEVSGQARGYRRLEIHDAEARQQVARHLTEAVRIMSGYRLRRAPLALTAIEAAVLWCDEQNPRSALARLDPRIRQALDRLCRGLGETIRLSELARSCGLSPSRLTHLFRKQVGLTPQRFLQEQRLARACQLLELTGQTVAEIAYEVGYDNPFYFTRRFKLATGRSPRAFRRQLERAEARSSR